MTSRTERNAILYCEGALTTTNGKTAHGLIRRSRRYRILSVVDSTTASRDAGEVLDGKPRGIPIYATVTDAVHHANASDPTHLVVGLAPDGGRLSHRAHADIRSAVEMGLHVVSGLHDYLTDRIDLVAAASKHGVTLTDVRKPPPPSVLHFFSGKIREVESLTVALLGTDSAVGKRTTAWVLVDALEAAGVSAEMVGTGQTSWLQGARYGIIMDALPNDFVSGEIEHAVWSAWHQSRPNVIVIEGQGSLLHPAYPGGFEILAAARPDVVVLQHAPSRQTYDGFPDFRLHPLARQMEAVELVSNKPVVAITLNHERICEAEARQACSRIAYETGRPTVDVLLDGAEPLVEAVLRSRRREAS